MRIVENWISLGVYLMDVRPIVGISGAKFVRLNDGLEFDNVSSDLISSWLVRTCDEDPRRLGSLPGPRDYC